MYLQVVLPGKKPQSLNQSPFHDTSDYSLQKNITFAADSSTGSGKVWGADNKTEISLSTVEPHSYRPSKVVDGGITLTSTATTITTWPVIITASPAETDFQVSTPAPQKNHEGFLPTPSTTVTTNRGE